MLSITLIEGLAMLHSLPVAFVSLAFLVPFASSQARVTPVLTDGATLPTGDVVDLIERWIPNRGGAGYAALLQVDPGNRREIWGDFVDDGTTSPQRLFTIPLSSGNVASNVNLTDVHEGHVVWSMHEIGPMAATTGSGAWVDGQLALDLSGPGPLPNTTWWQLPNARRITGGGLVVAATIIDGIGLYPDVITVVGASAPMLKTGDPIPGTSSSVVSVRSFDTSPSADHYVAVVYDQWAKTWLLVDGNPAPLYGSFLARHQPVPQEVEALIGEPVVQGGVTYAKILDDGDWSAVGMFYTYGGQYRWQAVRQGRLVGGVDHAVPVGSATLTPQGVSVDASLDEELRTPFGVLASASSPVDVDGDGVVDPAWSVDVISSVRSDGRGVLYSDFLVRTAAGVQRWGVARIEDRLPGAAICLGVPNSTGFPGRLDLVGSDVAAAGDLVLVAHGLPADVVGYGLVSDVTGLVIQPGGSAGNLCLGGAIGRYSSSVVSSGGEGAGATSIDLGAVPRPTGPVAAMAGQTWNFQFWHRDIGTAGATSNFTSAIGVMLR